jgi:transposase
MCHACGYIGQRSERAEFRCTNDESGVSEYQADLNAAANIAGRVDPWRACLGNRRAMTSWKAKLSNGRKIEDFPRRHRTGVLLTAPQSRERSAKTAQMTLVEWN